MCRTCTWIISLCRVSALFLSLSFFLSLQIFDEEYAVLYLDQGGALVAIRHTPLPIRHLWWVIMTETPFVTGWLIPSEEALSLKFVKQMQMSLSSNRGDDIIPGWNPVSRGEFSFDNCHSISPSCVWSRNESGFHWSLLAERSTSALCRIWNTVVRQVSGSLARAHSGGVNYECLVRWLSAFPGWALTRGDSGTSTASPTRLCLWTGCWESLGRRRSSWREWQRFVNIEIYQSMKNQSDSKVAPMCVCVCLCVCILLPLTQAWTACIYILDCLIQHSWLPVFLFHE